jgi:hypothetical protein
MKKLLAIALVATSLSANAFWNNNSMPWDNNSYNNGYQENNGMFGYNQYDYWDPRWYMEEMSNMVDDFDDNNNGWNNHNNGYNAYNSWNNGNNGNNFNGYNPYNNQNQWNQNQPIANALPAPVIPAK